MVVIEHISKGEGRYSIRRRLSERRIALREQGRSQGPPGEIVGTFSPRHRGGDLLPDSLEGLFRQDRTELVVSEELHAPLEMFGQDLETEIGACRLLGPDVIECFLKSHPVEGGGAVREELIQHLVYPFLSFRGSSRGCSSRDRR